MSLNKCSELQNPTLESYPECYAPLSLSEKEIDSFLRHYTFSYAGEDYTLDLLSKALNSGNISIPYWDYAPLIDYYISQYNRLYREYIEDPERYREEKQEYYYDDIENFTDFDENDVEITLEGTFNENNLYGRDEWDKTFDIIFESADEVMKLGNTTTEYRTLPAFWWDDDNDGFVDNNETLPGIWVGKYASTSDSERASQNIEIEDPTILPAAVIDSDIVLGNQNLSNQFKTSRNISKEGNIYGLNHETTNAHMMKNSELAALAYLKISSYGTNSHSYDTSTGNITGIYETTGTDSEDNFEFGTRVMATISSRVTCENKCDSSGFDKLPERKYYDVYPFPSETDGFGEFGGETYVYVSTFCTPETCGGQALYEFGNYGTNGIYLPNDKAPWLMRWHSHVEYELYADSGATQFVEDEVTSRISWRSVLVPGFSH
jgi:hypothetical protein